MARRAHVMVTDDRLIEALGLPPCHITGAEWDWNVHALRVFVRSPDLPYDVPEGGVAPLVTYSAAGWVPSA